MFVAFPVRKSSFTDRRVQDPPYGSLANQMTVARFPAHSDLGFRRYKAWRLSRKQIIFQPP
jgi:hypothetical protein